MMSSTLRLPNVNEIGLRRAGKDAGEAVLFIPGSISDYR